MQFPCKHFSLSAQFGSDVQLGKHIVSLHVFPSVQSLFDSHDTGTLKKTFYYL